MKVKRAVHKLDDIDRRILCYLQQQGRITYVELAKKVGLSTTPCMERVKKLENKGIIQGYTARLDPDVLELGLLIFVEISLVTKSSESFSSFEKAVLGITNILECHLVFGDIDYLIKALVPKVGSYRKMIENLLLYLPEVKESRGYVVSATVKENTGFPIVLRCNEEYSLNVCE